MSLRVSCPFCNAAVPLAEVPAGRRVPCPRCGETFPVKGDPGEAVGPAPSPNGEPAAEPPAGWSPRAVAAVGGALGLIVLAVGMGLTGRTPPTEPTVANPPAGMTTFPPAAVPGLRYLPAECGVAAAVQPGPLLAHAGRTGTDPGQLLTSLGVPAVVFTALDRLGLTLDQLDQLAAGLVLPADSAVPRLLIVTKLRRPPAADLLDRLKADRYRGPGGQERFKVQLGGLPMRLARPDPLTLLFATDDPDLDKAATPAAGSDHLPAGLRETLSQLSPASVAWVATDADDWAKRPTVQAALLVLKQPDLVNRLKLVRAAGVGLSLEPALRATAAVRAGGDGDKFRESVASAVAGREVQVGGAGPWTTVEADPAILGDLLPRRNGP
jgi:hypothetical protein